MVNTESASWRNPKILATLILVFVAGALAGATGMRLGLHDRIHPSYSGSLGSPKTAELFLGRCEKELNLTREQSEQMRTVLDDYKQYYQSLQDSLEEVRATGKSRIMAVLNEEQRVRFEKILSEMK
jgi:Spy/CpxP family protein refolding chaperone